MSPAPPVYSVRRGVGLLSLVWTVGLLLYAGLAPVGVELTFLGPQVGAQPLAMLVAISLAFVILVLHRRAVPLPMGALFILLFFCWAGATILWSVDRRIGLYLWAYRLHIVIPAAWFCSTLAVQPRVRTELVLRTYLAACVAAAVLSFAGFGSTGIQRLSLTETYNPTWLGGFLALGLFVAAWSITRRPSLTVRVLLMVAAGISVVGLAYTQSRNSIAGLVVGAVAAFVLRHLRQALDRHSFGTVLLQGARAALVIGLAGVGVWIAYMVVAQRTGITLGELDRLRRTVTLVDANAATGGRLDLWRRGLDFMTQPLWGVGYGSFPVLHEARFGRYLQAHNLYLQVMVDTGLIGLSLVVGLFATALRRLWVDRAGFVPFWTFCYLGLLGLGNDVMAYKHFWLGWFLLVVFLHEHRTGRAGQAPAEGVG